MSFQKILTVAALTMGCFAFNTANNTVRADDDGPGLGGGYIETPSVAIETPAIDSGSFAPQSGWMTTGTNVEPTPAFDQPAVNVEPSPAFDLPSIETPAFNADTTSAQLQIQAQIQQQTDAFSGLSQTLSETQNIQTTIINNMGN